MKTIGIASFFNFGIIEAATLRKIKLRHLFIYDNRITETAFETISNAVVVYTKNNTLMVVQIVCLIHCIRR